MEKLRLFNIQVQFIAPGSSLSNGLVEKRVGLSKEILRALRLTNKELSFDEITALISYNLNRRIVCGKKYSAEFLLFNQTLGDPNEIIKVASDATVEGEVLPDIQKSIDDYMEKRKARTEKQRENHNISRRQVVFAVGTLVWVNSKHLIQGQKSLRTTRTGPYIVEAITNKGLTAVLRHIDSQATIKRRTSLLTSAKEDFLRLLINAPLENQLVHEPE